MAHSVTVTRTTTTTSTTTAIICNIGFLKSFQGIVKLLQTLLNIVLVGIIAYYRGSPDHYQYYVEEAELYFLLVSVALLITTALLFLSCLISISMPVVLPKTNFHYLYHFVGFILYITASLTLLVKASKYLKQSSQYEAKLACSVIGLCNAGLYLIMAIFSYRRYHFG